MAVGAGIIRVRHVADRQYLVQSSHAPSGTDKVCPLCCEISVKHLMRYISDYEQKLADHARLKTLRGNHLWSYSCP